jgi:electron transfer flavoprotein-quinone oxidoreductase
MVERFDAIVVGAGPAGSSAALTLARKKRSVLLVERGRAPGAKNMFGGRIYAWPLFDLLPDWAKDCPIERTVTQENMAFLSDDSSLSVSLGSSKLSEGRRASFIALRAKFDAWLAKKAEAEGAVVVTGIRVDDLARESGRVHGVVVNPSDRVEADVVVIAEGASSNLVRRAGLRADVEPREVSVGVKETIALSPQVIQERFGLAEQEGAAFVFAGAASQGLRGGGFLYTNKASVSLGLVVSSEDLAHKRVEIQELQTKFRLHPSIQRYVKGGTLEEYSAHLVPELGLGTLPRLATDGVLVAGDAAGFLINNGYTFRGVDLAIASGVAAGETADAALSAGDTSANRLSTGYERALRDHHVLSDLETFARAPAYLKNERLFDVYPRLLIDLALQVYSVDGEAKGRLVETILKQTNASGVSRFRLLLDLLQGARSM